MLRSKVSDVSCGGLVNIEYGRQLGASGAQWIGSLYNKNLKLREEEKKKRMTVVLEV
jgi:hypothetical protein